MVDSKLNPIATTPIYLFLELFLLLRAIKPRIFLIDSANIYRARFIIKLLMERLQKSCYKSGIIS